MFYIGIDVAKANHCCSIQDYHGEIFVQPFYFQNNQDGFKLLFKIIKPYLEFDCIVGLEATGHYGHNLINFLISNNINVGLINPIITTNKRRTKIRKTKNDAKDTSLICSALHSKDYTLITKDTLLYREAKQLTRLYHNTVEDITNIKIQIQKCLDLVFPEYNKIFKTKYSRAYIAVLKDAPSANAINNVHLTKLKNIINKASAKKISNDYAFLLKQAAKSSIGEVNLIIELELSHLISMYELLQSQLTSIKEKIEELALQSNSPIFSIPGIGLITGLSILSEIRDINNFNSHQKLIAFSGCDPIVIQSGNFSATHTSISKRGSSFLRKSLYQVALTVVNNNTTFKQYYDKKISEGKSHRCAQGHLIRKLLRVIYTLLTKNIKFDLNLLK